MPSFANQETNDTNIKGIVMPSIANQDNYENQLHGVEW